MGRRKWLSIKEQSDQSATIQVQGGYWTKDYSDAALVGGIITHPDDVFIGHVMQGPFDRAYQGVQRWQSDSPAAMGMQIADIPNPTQRLQVRNGNIFTYYTGSSNPQAGPDVLDYQQQQDQQSSMGNKQKGLLSTILSKLGGS